MFAYAVSQVYSNRITMLLARLAALDFWLCRARSALVPPGEVLERTTNTTATLLGPTVTLPPVSIARDGAGAVTVEVGVVPRVRPEQAATLALDGAVAVAPARTTAADSLTFVFDGGPGVPTGPARVRLRVDGVESWLVDRAATPPQFNAGQQVTVP